MAGASQRSASEARTPHALLASALAGRPLELAWLDGADARAFTDGHTVFVPRARSDEAWLDVSLQALLVRHGSLARHALQSLIAQPERARGYLALELSRALAASALLLPRRVLEHPSLARLPTPARDLDDSLARARACARELRETPAAWGMLMPGRVLRAPRPDAAVAAGPEIAPPQAAALPARREREESRVLNAFRAPTEISAGFLGRLLAKLLELGPGQAARARGGAAGELQGTEAPGAGGGQQTRGGAPPRPVAPALPTYTAQSYPEWDERRRRYRRAWVQVAEVEPEPGDEVAAPPRAASSRQAARALQKTLRTLCLGYESRRHQRQGDDVEVDALVRLRADALSGHAADERIYRASLRTRRDLGVLVVLDITSSTRERAADGVSVFERQLAFALTLAQALHASGDRVACYAFHGWGRKLVRLPRLLGFGQRPDLAMRQRASWIAPVGYSRLGAAIRHGTSVLARDAGTPYRLLVLISDGIAYDQGYEGGYARADTRRALLEARAQATACVCLSLGSSADRETLAEVFGGAHYLSVPALSGAERSLGVLFERAVMEAGRRRAVSARRR